MLARGAKEVSAYVTHGVFPEESWKRFTNAKVPINSCQIIDFTARNC